MSRQVNIRGIGFFINTSPCAHNCRYCSTGKKAVSNVSFSRLTDLVERFNDWRLSQGLADFSVNLGVGHSDNYDVKTLKGLLALRKKLGHAEKPQSVYLDGLQWRPDDEMYDWLKARRDEAGIKSVHASIAGYGAVHDQWNARRGDFDFLMRTMHIAAKLGLRIRQRLFVVKSTLPLLDDLLQKLDTIEADTERYFSLFFYRGFGANHEEERITEDMRRQLPEHVQAYETHAETWRSEREWFDIAQSDQTVGKQHNVVMKLRLDEDMLDRIESLSCAEIFADLEERTRAAYLAVPTRYELSQTSSDPANRRIYSDSSDIENKWLDNYIAANSLTFERNLTHLWKDW